MEIPSSLKFVVSNLKNIVNTPLSAENYSLWRSQITKILRANAFEQFLDPKIQQPSRFLDTSEGSSIPNPAYRQWVRTDQNLMAAICSTISASVLPYIVNLDSTADLWDTLERRFQSSNRSKVIQLKNELHNITMKNQSMTQYLTDIKSLVDQIAAAGATVDDEDIILYILNGLPQPYQSFKTAIRTMLVPISLDNLYSLLLSEEVNIASDTARAIAKQDPDTALYASRGRGRRNHNNLPQNSNNRSKTSTSSIICQICNKKGHTTANCWHRMNSQYVPKSGNSSPKAMVAQSEQATTDWYLDSGASSHLTNSLNNLQISAPYTRNDGITVGDGRSVPIAHSGAGILPTPSRKLYLSQLLHIPKLHYNLLSISQLTRDNNISIVFDPLGFTLKDLKTNQVLLKGPCHKGLYPINSLSSGATSTALSATANGSNIWHQRLGHPHKRALETIAKSNPSLNISVSDSICNSCRANKGHKLLFEKSENRSNKILELIHSDVWGPSPVTSNQSFQYYVLFVDDFSRFTWLFPMIHKSEVTNIFINFKAKIENLTSHKIKCLRTDGGTEYVNHHLKQFLIQHGIRHQISCPYTPEQNGMAERKHRHVIETTRKLLFNSSVPYKYWPDAVLTATYLINRMPSPTIKNMSPYERLYHRKPTYGHLRTFGCECFPLTPNHLRHKLQPKAASSVFLGYSDAYKGYKCLDLATNKIHISRHTTFNEQSFPFSKHPMITRNKSGSLKPRQRLNLFHEQVSSIPASDPTTFNEANKHFEWRQAMAHEFFALQKQGTWQLVSKPSNAPILGCKWTYRTKRHANGSIVTYKARLVALGNHQEFGIDYNETFSPVAKLPTIRILLTVALNNNWPVQQLDVANAFLHGNLSEVVYMTQPKGFEDSSHPEHVCLLKKAIYGLKQAPRQWYNTFTSYLLSIGFTHSKSDPSLLIQHQSDTTIFLLMYVDDILITGNKSEAISHLLQQLNSIFTMKNLGSVNSFLGINITHNTDSYFLSQKSYAQSILQQAFMVNCKSISNPSCTKLPNQFSEDKLLADPVLYRRLTGSLQYLTLTRPDIAYTVNLLSQHMHNPLSQHIFMLKRLLRYIQGTLSFGIPITKSKLTLQSFSDADWAGDPISRKSTSGYCSFLGTTLISWTVKKQHTTARSSTESEYRALAAAAADIIWLRRILSDFNINTDLPTDVYCDNTSAIALANNPVFHARTKHIEIDQHFIRDHIANKAIRLLPISTVDQVADIFTKPLSTPRFQKLRDKLTVSQAPSVCGGVLEHNNNK
ncbi:Retrovirus-related Pol polyprotein from transposon TNT 1-94 [Dendrobium catenatum]|uniref:Retrovirus-related Pol polyprotein from transposon TNT 1-94 n=1 Tax=Dendrobium catenatum TaxID=906689 RepID=A0A2I0XGI6_9ASPA|nr:Retrovirus-related Pol polyprotein from transposon TNT 1-94 [Dendrobium catenatum]